MIADFFVREHEPEFLNEGTSRSELELKKLEAIRLLVSDDDKERLEQDIRILKAGVSGENKVVFELRNSHYPLVFIHDLRLEHEGTSAQIDFLVVTPYCTYAIECKNLVGNIEVKSDGSFVRTFGKGCYRTREGIYSPIAQSVRHVELLKAIVRSGHGAAIQFAQHFFLDDFYHSVVVLANERSLLDIEEAPADIRRQVIRADQLIAHIKRIDKKFARKNGRDSFAAVRKRAAYWLALNAPRADDVAARYKIVGQERYETQRKPSAPTHSVSKPQTQAPATQTPSTTTVVPNCPKCGAPMVLRTASKGQYKGSKFWGCSTYAKTRCRGIISVDNRDV